MDTSVIFGNIFKNVSILPNALEQRLPGYSNTGEGNSGISDDSEEDDGFEVLPSPGLKPRPSVYSNTGERKEDIGETKIISYDDFLEDEWTVCSIWENQLSPVELKPCPSVYPDRIFLDNVMEEKDGLIKQTGVPSALNEFKYFGQQVEEEKAESRILSDYEGMKAALPKFESKIEKKMKYRMMHSYPKQLCLARNIPRGFSAIKPHPTNQPTYPKQHRCRMMNKLIKENGDYVANVNDSGKQNMSRMKVSAEHLNVEVDGNGCY